MLSADELSQLNNEERQRFSSGNLTDKMLMATELKEKARLRAIEKGVQLNGMSAEQLRAIRPPELYGSASASPSRAATTSAPSRYGAARGVIAVVDVIGVLMMVVGALWFVASLTGATGGSSYNPYGGLLLLGLLPSLGMVVGGVLIFAHGQTQRATLDTADLTREILAATKALASQT